VRRTARTGPAAGSDGSAVVTVGPEDRPTGRPAGRPAVNSPRGSSGSLYRSLGRVAELADAQDSGSCVRKDVGVQVPPRPRRGCRQNWAVRVDKTLVLRVRSGGIMLSTWSIQTSGSDIGHRSPLSRSGAFQGLCCIEPQYPTQEIR
jgi:hypothetical protein